MESMEFQKIEKNLLHTLLLFPGIAIPLAHYILYEKKIGINHLLFLVIYIALQFWIRNTVSDRLKPVSISLYYLVIFLIPLFFEKMLHICLVSQIVGIMIITFEKNSKLALFFHALAISYDVWILKDFQNPPFEIAFVVGYGAVTYISIVLNNVISRMYEKILELSTTDDLTGLLNQKGFLKRIEEEYYRSQRYGKSFGLIMIDSDDLKRVNDTYGHKYGNMIINMVARVIRESIRRTDFAGRFGGDEYMICLVETELEPAINFGEKIRKTIEMKSLFTEKGKDLKATISVGIASYPKSGKDLYEIIENADKALYMAKNDGKNKVKYVVIN